MNISYGKLPAKEPEEMPQNTLYVDLIGPYVVRRKGKKENINQKAVMMIYHVPGWFEITQCNNNSVISIAKLV